MLKIAFEEERKLNQTTFEEWIKWRTGIEKWCTDINKSRWFLYGIISALSCFGGILGWILANFLLNGLSFIHELIHLYMKIPIK